MTENITLPELEQQLEEAESRVSILKAKIEQWVGPKYGEIQILNPESDLTTQFSPEEAISAEGWQTVYPKGFGRLPRWINNTDFSAGLDISRNRSNGCFIIRNEREIADSWVRDPVGAASALSSSKASPRVCLLAGTMMQYWRYMFPTFNFEGGLKLEDYAFEPDIPFNDAEKQAFESNFIEYHLSGGALLGAHLQRYGSIKFDGEHVDLTGKHRILTVANHPQWILPGAMDHWNSHLFIRKAYVRAQRVAFGIDEGNNDSVPGYTTPEQWGGGSTQAEWARWRSKRERHGKSLPFSLLIS